MSTLNDNKDRITDLLRRLEVHTVECTYSGSGDSGQVEEVDATDRYGNTIPLTDTLPIEQEQHEWGNGRRTTTLRIVHVTLSQAIEDFIYNWLSDNYGGWEIDDGSSGTLTINVEDGTYTFRHTTYSRTENTEEHEA